MGGHCDVRRLPRGLADSVHSGVAITVGDLQEAPKNLANAIDEVEGLEAEHKEVKARQSAEWKKLRAKIASSAR